MRRFVSVLTVAAVLGLAVAASPVQAASTNPFLGRWTSIDHFDGSTQSLSINGGTNVSVRYIDSFGSVCVNVEAPVTQILAEAVGTVTGNTLNAVYAAAHCGSFYLWWWHGGSTAWTYDPGTDTLFDGFDHWFRS